MFEPLSDAGLQPTGLESFAAMNAFSRDVFLATSLAEAADIALDRLMANGFAQRVCLTGKLSDGEPFDRFTYRDPAEASMYQVRGFVRQVVERLQTWNEEVILLDIGFDESLRSEAEIVEVDVGSVLCYPLGLGPEDVVGGLYLDRGTQEAPFDELDAVFGRHCALVIGQVLSALARQDAALKRQEHLETLLGIFRTVAGSMELHTVLDHIAQVSLTMTKAERAFLLLVDGDQLKYGAGRNREGVLSHTSFKLISHSVCDQVISTYNEVCLFDTGDETTNTRQSVVNLQLRGVVAVPLMGRNELVGILYIDSRMRTLDGLRKEMKLLRTIGGVASLLVENARSYRRMTVDPLTGLYTAGLLAIRIDEEISRSKRYDRSCALLMIHLDSIDEIARDCGESRADVARTLVARVLLKHLRVGIDFPAMASPERMIVILPETGADGALTVAERIRVKVDNASFVGTEGEPLRISVSIGIGLWHLPNGTGAELQADALRCLERARALGGNRTIVAN